jgi:GWxTD domain-containing protein
MRHAKFLILLFALVLWACASTKRVVEQQNQASIYNPGSSYLHPDYLIFHQNEIASQLILKLNQNELLFNQANPEHSIQALIKLHFELIDITDNPFNKSIADSATTIKKIEKVPEKNLMVFTFYLKAQYGKIYSLRVILTDLLRNVKQQNYVSVNKLNKYSGQNFKVISRLNELPIFRNFVIPNEPVRVITNQPEIASYFVKYQKDLTSLPPPPFSVQKEPNFTFRADSIWKINYSSQQSLIFSYPGLYLIQTDTTKADGLFITNLGKSFPKVTEPDKMIPPLEYLTTTSEIDSLRKSDNSKLVVDNFWYKAAGNLDMAREMIRIYYNRMFYANLFFTSYKEGWKTDRGMIYLIFGPPSYITKNAVRETWEYFVKQDGSNLTISFDKTPSPYSENHYIMQRGDAYSRFWRTAVGAWRKGKAYSLEE